ncbi:MAG: four helix bundle protein [Desulfobacterales bacterium]|nr:four helix bundle protein [Desulfobacterales bacterium]
MTERKKRFGETMKRPALERQARSGPGGNEETAGEKGGQRGSRINSYKDLRVYQNAMEAAMKVFDLTKTFPTEERYSMVDQARRASRSVCTNVADAIVPY